MKILLELDNRICEWRHPASGTQQQVQNWVHSTRHCAATISRAGNKPDTGLKARQSSYITKNERLHSVHEDH